MEEKKIEEMTTEEIHDELARLSDDDGFNISEETSSGIGTIAVAVGALAAVAGGAILWMKHRKRKKAERVEDSYEEDSNFKEVEPDEKSSQDTTEIKESKKN